MLGGMTKPKTLGSNSTEGATSKRYCAMVLACDRPLLVLILLCNSINKTISLLKIRGSVAANNDDGLALINDGEMLREGLQLLCSDDRINRVNGDPWTSKRNIQRFKDHFGTNHWVIAQVWNDLCNTDHIPQGHAKDQKLSLTKFLQTLHFLCRCQRESEREATFDTSPKTLRTWCWYYIECLHALKAQKIVFPTFDDEVEGDEKNDIWIVTVDGVHCATYEPKHEVYSKDPKYFSHKKRRAGLCCELGVDLFASNLIWMNGPFPAGRNDNGNFVQAGLKEKLTAIGKKALADKAYNGHPEVCSAFNAFDSEEVKQLKSRAQMRHEQFNGMIKEFSVLENRFRHSESKFKLCFESICVICQHRMELGEPLFDLLAGIHPDDEDSSSDEGSDSDYASDESSSSDSEDGYDAFWVDGEDDDDNDNE